MRSQLSRNSRQSCDLSDCSVMRQVQTKDEQLLQHSWKVFLNNDFGYPCQSLVTATVMRQKSKNHNILCQTLQTSVSHCMVLDGPIGGREAIEPWHHPRTMEGHREPCMARTSIHCLDLYIYLTINNSLVY